mmetsp:Transcript_7262/g.10206  ORF Transcript_7262/g.10206 Transcript_7262/m.10206 type:complete len:282 (+) Transcript_7262:165-1010(+)
MYRSFSEQVKQQKTAPKQKTDYFPWFMLATGVCGFATLNFMNDNSFTPDSQQTKADATSIDHDAGDKLTPLVQDRIGKTFGWLGYGILTTSTVVGRMRHNFYWQKFHPVVWFTFAMIAFANAYHLDYNEMFIPKVAAFTCFTGFMGMMILPIVMQASASLAADAALITGASMMGLAGIAYVAPSETYLSTKGPLTFASMLLMMASSYSVMWPASRAIYNSWLVCGTVITSAMVMYHSQEILHEAKTAEYYDPLGSCISLYLDGLRLFVFILSLLENNDTKK